MGTIVDVVRQFLEEDGWRYYPQEDSDDLFLDISARNGVFTCYARPREDKEQFVFYVMCPVKAPENKRHAISEFLSRVNYGLIIGNFELDFRDGEIRYKTSIDVEEGTLTPPMVGTLIMIGVSMMDRYLPGIMSVIYGGVLPDVAVAKIEGE
jgi:hypothetical protein